jgi:hypothetical protein
MRGRYADTKIATVEATAGSRCRAETTVLASRRFRSLEHDTTGRALLVKLADGSVLLVHSLPPGVWG